MVPILGTRQRAPTIYIGFEYLGRRFIEIEKQKGINAIIPTTREGLKIGDAS